MNWEDRHETLSNPGTRGESDTCWLTVRISAQFPKPNVLELEGSEQSSR